MEVQIIETEQSQFRAWQVQKFADVAPFSIHKLIIKQGSLLLESEVCLQEIVYWISKILDNKATYFDERSDITGDEFRGRLIGEREIELELWDIRSRSYRRFALSLEEARGFLSTLVEHIITIGQQSGVDVRSLPGFRELGV